SQDAGLAWTPNRHCVARGELTSAPATGKVSAGHLVQDDLPGTLSDVLRNGVDTRRGCVLRDCACDGLLHDPAMTSTSSEISGVDPSRSIVEARRVAVFSGIGLGTRLAQSAVFAASSDPVIKFLGCPFA